MMSDDRATTDITALLSAAGLTLTDDEARQLAAYHARFSSDCDRLRQVNLGETEPAVTFKPVIEPDES